MAFTESVTYSYNLKDNGFSKNLEKMKGKTKDLDKYFISASTAVVGFGSALVAGGVGAFKFAGFASDMEESLNVVNVVFGESADDIIKWSETSLERMNMSQQKALEMAGTYGRYGESMGLTKDQTLEYSKSLTVLSADMASFNNISQDRAFEALMGIYTGETEALGNLGISILETSVNQSEYAKSIGKTQSQMTETEKIQARYSIVMKATSNAQMDAVNTGEALANTKRRVTGIMQNLAVAIGQKLLPAIENMALAIEDVLMVALALVTGETSKLTDSQQEMLDKFNTMLPIIVGVGKVLGTLFGIYLGLSVVIWITNFALAVGTTAVKLKATADFLLAKSTWKVVWGLIAQAGAFLLAYWPILLVVAGVGLLIWAYFEFEIVQKIVNTLLLILAYIIIGVVFIAIKILGIAIKGIILILQFMADIIINVVVMAFNLLKTIMVFVADIFMTVLNTAINIVKNSFQLFANVVKFLIDLALFPLKLLLAILSGDMDNVKAVVGELAGSFSNVLKSAINLVMNPIRGLINLFGNLWGMIKNVIGAITGGLVGAFNAIPLLPNIGNKTLSVGMAQAKSQVDSALSGFNLNSSSSNVVNNSNQKTNVFNFDKVDNRTFSQIQRQAMFAKKQSKAVLI